MTTLFLASFKECYSFTELRGSSFNLFARLGRLLLTLQMPSNLSDGSGLTCLWVDPGFCSISLFLKTHNFYLGETRQSPSLFKSQTLATPLVTLHTISMPGLLWLTTLAEWSKSSRNIRTHFLLFGNNWSHSSQDWLRDRHV